jgi:Fe2+ or Zn2+ uptake regulation protein
MELELLIELYKKHNYKITEQRKAILTVMLNHDDKLSTVDTIYNEAKALYPKTNMSTVYRNLEILESLKLLHKTVGNNGAMLYKLICCHHHHHHLICSNCGKTEVIDYCPMEAFKSIASEKGYELTDHKLELIGLCNKCSKKTVK